MDLQFTTWPLLNHVIVTAGFVAAAYGLGFVVNAVLIRWLQRLASRTSGDWDDAVVLELRKRVPFWSVLAGLWFAIDTWTLQAKWILLSHRIVGALAVVSVTLAVSAITVGLMVGLAPRVHPAMRVSGLMRNVVRGFIFAIGALIVLRGFGVEITPMLAALGVGGLAAALALQDPLSSLFSGLFISLAGNLHIGDYVRLDNGIEGQIVDFSWNATTLRSMADNLVVLPNIKLAQAIVTNYEGPTPSGGFVVEFIVGVDSDLALVERLAGQVALSVEQDGVGAEPQGAPVVRFQAFTDLGVRGVVALRSRRFEEQALIRHEVVKRLQAEFTRAGIELPTLGKTGQRSEVRGQR